MFKLNFSVIYTVLLTISIVFILCSCATCPGAKNLSYPQFYKAQDLMKYELSEKCMISKTDSARFNGYDWIGTINQTDDIIFTFKDEQLNYFRLVHHNTYEELYQRFGKYIQFFDTYGMNYKYIRPFTFKCDYLGWSVTCYWRSEDLTIVCTRKG